MFNDTFGKMSPWGLIRAENQKDLQIKFHEYVKGMHTVDCCLQMYKKRDVEGNLLMGSEFSLAECMAAPILLRAVATLKGIRGVDIQKLAKDLDLSHLAAWMDAVLSWPSVTKTTPPLDFAEDMKKVHPEWIKCEEKLEFTVSGGQIVFSNL
eukprot:gnl/MRDRNA2_/MRDRNA2_128616_c0_seq1.p1 gnl/MRDRNA2_/MRDRNA2_128616_c0~~gnl/MRDRNA2_/MRDRNA2_128616_c0_seq1.p1  ORF type:complete len:152 (+),score=37.87 gnl/MRDRNA2_/MRDRNA2_128616_c0_seq1:446-901(+)